MRAKETKTTETILAKIDEIERKQELMQQKMLQMQLKLQKFLGVRLED